MSGSRYTNPNMLGIRKELAGGRAYVLVFSGSMMSWWAHQDSNLGPSDYESDALTN